MAWFRFYDEVLDDPKVQQLPAKTFKNWVNILCLAKRNDGVLPPIDDIAFALRMTGSDAEALIKILKDNKLLDDTSNGIVPHNWSGRQYKSDVSTSRVKRFRKRRETPDETPPETETERKKAPSGPKKTTIGLQGLTVKMFDEFAREKVPRVNVLLELERFRDHCRKKGQRWKDYPAAFRNWLRKAQEFHEERKGNGINQHESGGGGRATKDERAKAAIAKGLAVEIPEPSQ